MKLKDILSISGRSGLYKFISQGRNAIIVEAIEDGKRMAISSSAKVSALEDIAIFTKTEEISLSDCFKKIFERENGKQTIDHKSSPDELKAFMQSILPEYDSERVYVSDMKKLIMWYNILISHNLLNPNEEEEEEEEKETGEHEDTKDKPVKREKKQGVKPNKPSQIKNVKASTAAKAPPRVTKPKTGKTD
jgi:hypothetical protein